MKFKINPHNNYNSICIKRWKSFLLLFLFSLIAYSQTPEGFNYQSVVRDASGDIISNSAVGVQFKLHQTTASGTVVYTETHTRNTNAYGVFNLVVGQGNTTDDFSSINWSADSYFIEVSIDTAGGTTYVSMGTTQLLSVPYALQAKYVENGDNLGNHTLTENIKTDGKWISNDGDNEGIAIKDDGSVGIGESNPQTSLDVVDTAVIGNISIGSQSTPQNASNNKDLGFTTTPWLYTNAIEAAGERGTGSTLITIGNDGNFGANDEIHFITDGSSQVDISDGLLNVSGNIKTTGSLDAAGTAAIGNIAVGSQSTTQSTSNQKDEGFTTTPWLYTSAIQAPGERDSSPTLIAVGNDNNFGGSDEIHFVTNGSSQVDISNGLLNVSGNIKSSGNFEFDGILTTTSTENQIFGTYDDTSKLSNLSENNVIIGTQAAENATSGGNNVVIGYFAGYNLNGSSNVILGQGAGLSGTAFSNRLYIRDLIYGEFDNDLLQVKGELKVDENIATDGNVIIDEDGDDLIASGATRGVEIISLIIDTDGSIQTNVTGSSGITTSLSDETYTIDYSGHFSVLPAVTITCISTTSRTRIGQIISLGQGNVSYKVKSENNNSETDAITVLNIVGRR